MPLCTCARPQPVQRLLQERGFVQRDVARFVGIDPSDLSRVLLGRRRPTPEMRRRLAQLLGVDEAELFTTDADEAMSA